MKKRSCKIHFCEIERAITACNEAFITISNSLSDIDLNGNYLISDHLATEELQERLAQLLSEIRSDLGLIQDMVTYNAVQKFIARTKKCYGGFPDSIMKKFCNCFKEGRNADDPDNQRK